MNVEQVAIRGEVIRLGQLLKLAGVVDGGAAAKALLGTEPVLVNGTTEQRRGRQLRDGDLVEVAGRTLRIVTAADRSDAAER